MDDVERLRQVFDALSPVMDERTTRLWAAAEAQALGRGGVTKVTAATGILHKRIAAGKRELEQMRHAPPEQAPRQQRIRREGAGRKRLETPLTAQELTAFGAELDALCQSVMRDLGEKDARHIRDMVARARLAEVCGRALLFSGLFPPAWGAGVALLALSKIFENMEIGHNVLHGQYDWMHEPSLNGATYEWDWSCPAADWRHSHNFIHHKFRSILGKDRDIGYGLLRMTDEQAWHPANILQPLYAIGQMVMFESAIAAFDLELEAVLKGNKTIHQLFQDAKPMLRKSKSQVLKDYVWFPLVGGLAAPAIFTGNLRFHILSGHLSHQIEHHLFPDMPAPRYPEIAGEVEAICIKYGILYNSASFSHQVRGALIRVVRGAFPFAMAARGRDPSCEGDALGAHLNCVA